MVDIVICVIFNLVVFLFIKDFIYIYFFCRNIFYFCIVLFIIFIMDLDLNLVVVFIFSYFWNDFWLDLE